MAILSLLASLLIGMTGSTSAYAMPTLTNVKSWGDSCCFGYTSYSNSDTPAAVSSESYVTQISAASGVLELRNTGEVRAWGYNQQGRLGIGTSTYLERTPSQVHVPPAVQVSAGANNFGLTLDGTGAVYSFGRNNEGELGRSISGYEDANPAAVSGLPSITAISAGGSHSVALASNGAVWAWGSNSYGQTGDPTNSSTPRSAHDVTTISGAIKVAAGGNSSYAVDSSGNVWSWGDNSYGQLGRTTVSSYDAATPTQISGPHDIIDIAAGARHVLALEDDGTIWSWGSNQFGQMGDGGSLSSGRSPVHLSSLSDVIFIGSGPDSYNSYAVKSDGTAWAWGSNWGGSLGDSSSTERDTPVQLTALSDTAGVVTSEWTTFSWGTLPTSTATVSSLSAAVEPDSPLYSMRVSASISGASCPATITVTIGSGLTRSKVLCTSGTAPTSTTLDVGVLSLDPETNYGISAFVNDANGVTAAGTGNLTTPGVPVFVAVGDSYSSGHHQDTDEPCNLNGALDPDSFAYAAAAFGGSGNWSGTCLDATGAGANSLAANDHGYSWVSKSVDSLMTLLAVPARWEMDVADKAVSGAKTSEYATSGPSTSGCPGCGEQDAMETELNGHAGSWNIVSVNGGANDADLAGTLHDYYVSSNGTGKPWESVLRTTDCPDTDALDARVNTSTVHAALSSVLSDALTADPNVRRIALTYPYILPPDGLTSICQGDSIYPPYLGAGSVVDHIDTALTSLASTSIEVVDLRSASGFGASRMDDIQQTRYFGYPHLNSDGQDDVAAAVVAALLS